MHRITTAAFIVTALAVTGCDGPRQTPTTPTTSQPPATPVSPAPPPPPSPDPGSDDPLVGRYALTVDLGSGCRNLPEAARVRQYSATINATRDASYVVTLSEARFLTGLICTFTVTGLGCDQFLASRRNDVVEFNLVNNNDDGHGGHIVEQLPTGTWIEIIGDAAGRLSPHTIEAIGTSSVWYCQSSAGYPFPCATYTGCGSRDMRLTFTRKSP